MNRLWIRLSLAFAIVVIVVLIVFGIAARIALESNENLQAGAPAEVREYFEQVRQESGAFNMTAVLLIVGVVAIGAGVWMSKTLTAPLKELDEAAGAIGRQELSHRVTVRGSDELKAVASGFNEMAHQLEEAESLRSNLLADVAHELRNPLHVLSGNLQAMLDDVYPMTKEEIARLSDQTRHLTTIVDDLHVLAQAEAHQMPLDRQPADIAILVKETTGTFEAVARAQDIQLKVELLGSIPSWEVDADRFRQALGNLLSNALRHTPGGGQIAVTVQQENQALCISVRDTGAGMKPEQLIQVFDRFYRSDEVRSRDQGGTGLGLAITRAIIEAHGGQISAASPSPGQGSTFTISLPM